MQAVTFFFAFVVVLALIGVAAWLVRQFAGNRLGANTNRGRMPRLAVIDAAAVDGRRRLVLVRRDNVEHLIMIGGPTDIVVEPNIVRATAGRDQLPQRPAGAEPPPRIAPLPDPAAWADEGLRADIFDHPAAAQMPEPPPRPARPSFAEEARRMPPALSERRAIPWQALRWNRSPVRNPGTSRDRRSGRSLDLSQDLNRELSCGRNRCHCDRSRRRCGRSRCRCARSRCHCGRSRCRCARSRCHAARTDAVAAGTNATTDAAARRTDDAAPLPGRAKHRRPRRCARPNGRSCRHRRLLPPPAPPPPAPQPSADQNLAEMAQRLEAALRRPAADALAPPVAPEPPRRPPGVARRAARRSSARRHALAEKQLREFGRRDGVIAGPSEVAVFVRPEQLPRRVLFLAVLIAATTLAVPAFAQDISINLGQGNGGVTERAIQLIALLTVLSIAPSILIMMTSFTRIVVVLSLLRTAMGTSTAPPNSVIIALAMFLTAFVMGPVLQKSYDDGIKPLIANQITVEEALQRASVPLRGFMEKNVREKDLKLFMDLSGEPPPATPEEMSLRILVPAFMISELKRAFEIGFLLFLPFLIIDLVVASVLMSMGMMMLPPVVVSLPFKLIFFVLVDGWSLVAGSLVQSYGGQ